MAWVLNDAPGLPANAFGTLMGLANHADHQGRGVFIAQATLSRYARKTDRQVRRDLAELEKLNLIRRGDQRLVAHLPPMKRPIVWDLALELRETVDSDRTPTTGHGSPAGHARPVTDVRPDIYDRSYTAARPDAHVLQTVIEPTTPTAEVRRGEGGTAPRKRATPPARGTRIPDDFRLTREMVAWGEENFPNVNGEKETAKFIDHFRAATGTNAVKRDWPATWRNWIRRAEKDYPQSVGARAAAMTPATSDLRAAQAQASLQELKADLARGGPFPRNGAPIELSPAVFREIEP
jgi:hypothetical protein